MSLSHKRVSINPRASCKSILRQNIAYIWRRPVIVAGALAKAGFLRTIE
jgi:hypothetical protein